MAIVRFENAPSNTLSAFKDFLDENKEGTFLENITVTLDTNSDGSRYAKMWIGSERTFYISCLGTANKTHIASFTGTYTSLEFDNFTGTDKVAFRFSSAILCTNGLILSGVDTTDNKTIQRIIITVDDEGGLALIVPAKSAYSFSAADTDYAVIVSDSTVPTPLNIGPSYSSNVTSLAPIPVKALGTTRMLPYVYAALTTQLNSEGLQSVEIDGVPFITNGIFYIKDDGE